MKKFFMFLAVASLMTFTASIVASAQEEEAAPAAVEQVADDAEEVIDLFAGSGEEVPLHQALKTKFIEGGAGFMSLIIICLILGMALAIERILYLAFSKTNTTKLLDNVEKALEEGGIEKAKEVCRNTRGPVASIFYQGLLRADQGVDVVEKTIVSYGGVQMSLMENGLSWIGLFISIAPSLGFLGTVIGMRIVTSPEQLVDALGLGGARRHRGDGGSWVTSQAGDPPEKVLQALLARKYGPGSPLVGIGLAVMQQRGITPVELAATVRRPYGEVLAGIGTLEADGFLTTDLLQRCSIAGKFA